MNALSTALAWLRANILTIAIVVLLVAGCSILRSCFLAGQVKELLDTGPKPKSAKQVKALQNKVKELTQEKVINQQRADSAYAKTVSPERDAALRKHLIDSLTTAYHAIPADTSLANPTAVSEYLRSYRPGADADL